jgi:hypothetical protein
MKKIIVKGKAVSEVELTPHELLSAVKIYLESRANVSSIESYHVDEDNNAMVYDPYPAAPSLFKKCGYFTEAQKTAIKVFDGLKDLIKTEDK